MKQVISMLLTILFSTVGYAQTCVGTVTDTSRYTVNANGTILDSQTGLMWQRCNFGQSYNSTSQNCEGDSQQLTWQQALIAASQDSFADFSDWHVPNIKELASIVLHQCVAPAVNATIFPTTKSNNYWSATTQASQPTFAWAYQFADGKNNPTNKTSDAFVRLVRYYQ
ncbi:Lcl C-terminal domain-containing protein [Pseudoalteromonas peptidolytica]|uniref:Lcl C-terminal domain-containing protein n=1 Tax=Pseudoalteromonas peptidolytica F12-50-A1 TaxID=1315280 RepID=A0A8I0MSM5_9GAMM|nr:DUF1566 domain-containing protein [Pseudoalteromonas peptidolytica]MBE0345067.1 hypothetical protein [Pseudoalteromonas peptidolytica F12-50-A1]NLR14932.1 DUF1566 domain-containing protein [Pseudoalteromonas peptidolytica]GEK09397.1 hypothetical protein PPE03_16460 [Pseudoalteromonas peptidolytica]